MSAAVHQLDSSNKTKSKVTLITSITGQVSLSNDLDSSDLDSSDLDSFRSPFWLKEKHWFVAYAYRTLFSVPHFIDTFTTEDFHPPEVSTVPNNTILYENITDVAVSDSAVNINYRFPRAHTLCMNQSIPLLLIERVVDLIRIQHLILTPTTCFDTISTLNKMPNLCQISINSEVKHFLEEVRCKSFKKIRKLQIGDWYLNNNNTVVDNYSIEQLNSVFPHIEYLHICYLCSMTQILDSMSQFKYLTSASFYCMPWYASEEFTKQNMIEPQTTLDQILSFQKLNFTYRLGRSTVYVWM